MVNWAGSGGTGVPYSFSCYEKEEIEKIMKRWCAPEKLDCFINQLERGVRVYLKFKYWQSELSVQSNKEAQKEVENLQNSLDKVFNQLQNICHVNESMIDQQYLLREKRTIPIVAQNGWGNWAEGLQILVQDISIASGDYLQDLKIGSSGSSFGVELHLVDAIYSASVKCCPSFIIRDGSNSTAPKIIDCFIDWLDIKSKHKIKRSTADNDISNSSIPLASGRSIVRSWLNHGDNRQRTRNQ